MIVTPRMHGIHHSIVEAEAGSNFGSLFPWWDDLHGTRRLDVPQAALTIGVPAYLDARDAGLRRVLALPFESPRPSWRFPDGGRPERAGAAAAGRTASRPELVPALTASGDGRTIPTSGRDGPGSGPPAPRGLARFRPSGGGSALSR